MTIAFDIENIAGIRAGQATVEPGVNAVRGLNWQGKTSFVRSIQTAMGTELALTEGADRGSVTLTRGDERVEVELLRDDGRVTRRGQPYLDDEYDRICADLYAFLDDRNEVRAAVRSGADLEAVLTRPLDFEDIDTQIRNLKHERQQAEAALESARAADRKRTDLAARISRLEDELAELRAERDELLSEAETPAATDGTREELSDARADLSQVDRRIERLEDTIERTEAKLADRREERADLEVPEVDVEAELAEVQSEIDRIETDRDLLQGLYSATRRLLEEDRIDLVSDVDRGLMADSVECWVCGAEADTEAIERQTEALGERLADLEATLKEYETRRETLQSQRAEAEQVASRQRDLDREITDLEATLSDRRETLAGLRERRAELDERVDELAAEVVDNEEQLTELQSEIKYTETELSEAREQQEELAAEAEEIDALEAQIDELSDELTRLRERKATIKREMREAFDELIGELIEQFETSFETARLTSSFDLVVARDGREVSRDALSEGELELIGIVAALAGHQTYDVHERVPFLVLDGLGSLAEANLLTLVEYVSGWAEYLVFTAYPEHSSLSGNEIDPTEWDVVSDRPRAQ